MVLTTPILEGLDGVQKMSKSLGNAIGIHEPPLEMYGKMMSISDEMMWRYYELLTDVLQVQTTLETGDSDARAPSDGRRRKHWPAGSSDFHSGEAAGKAGEDWAKRFQSESAGGDRASVEIRVADVAQLRSIRRRRPHVTLVVTDEG